MKQYRYSLLSLALFSLFYAQNALADLRSQCLAGVPHFQGEEVTGDQLQMPVYVEADALEVNYPERAHYQGGVTVLQGNRYLEADDIYLEKTDSTHKALLSGRYRYLDNLINTQGVGATLDLNSRQAQLGALDYQLVGRQGRGRAEKVELNDSVRILKNATYTACLPNDKAWSIEAKEMIQYVQDEYAELWHAKFRIFDIPILYSPYLQFPIGERRRSGLLAPTNVGHSTRDGFSYGQPIYWNIAPNSDMTFTPTYYSSRGWQFSPEVRYLSTLGEGKIAGDYMHRDRLPEWLNKNQARYLLFWQHRQNFMNHWRLAVNYTRVSDRRYFSDFDSGYGNSTDGYANQQIELGYYKPSYNLSISAKKFQTFDETGTKPYRVFPQITLNYYKNDLVRYGDFSLFGQISHFANDSKEMPSAWRFHLSPSLNFPLANRYGSFNFETKLYATHYLQKKGEAQDAETIRQNVTRILPQIKLDLKTTLEAENRLFNHFTQVLEPRIQYLYRPYKDQQNIGSKRQNSLGLGYDSALLQQDYYALFNDRRYSGLDRIASANQITFGGSTRFFDERTGGEVFNLSAGQIYYLSPSRIDSISDNSVARRSSSWSIESNWQPHPQWNWHGSYQYDTRLKESSLANMSLQFKPSDNQLVQLNYRYASKNYINQNLSTNLYGQDIKQLGGVIGWDMSDHLSMMFSHYHDLALKKPVETQMGLTYHSCCWNATLYTARQLTATPADKIDTVTVNDLYYDNRLGLNFELRFGDKYHSALPKMLSRGLIPYVEAFNIN